MMEETIEKVPDSEQVEGCVFFSLPNVIYRGVTPFWVTARIPTACFDEKSELLWFIDNCLIHKCWSGMLGCIFAIDLSAVTRTAVRLAKSVIGFYFLPLDLWLHYMRNKSKYEKRGRAREKIWGTHGMLFFSAILGLFCQNIKAGRLQFSTNFSPTYSSAGREREKNCSLTFVRTFGHRRSPGLEWREGK